MRIAVDVRSLLAAEPTGVGTYTKELLTALIAADTTTEWVVFSNAYGRNAPFASPNPRVTVCHTKIPNKIFNTLTALGVLTLDNFVERKTKLKIDHWFSPNLHFTPLSHTPLTLTVHDTTFFSFPTWYTQKQRFKHWLTRAGKQCLSAKLIITPSLSTANDVHNHMRIPRNKIETLPLGLSEEFRTYVQSTPAEQQIQKINLTQKYSLPEHYVLYLGALEPRKNIESIVAAFETVHSSLPDSHALVIAGAHGWGNSKLFSLLETSSVAKHIRYLGYVKEEEKLSLLAGAGTLLYPSYYEGFGLPVLEALALGVPVITSPRASLFEIAGKAAYYAHPEHPLEIAEGLKLLLTNSPLRAKKISQGITQALHFSWKETAAKLLDSFKQS